MKPILAEPKANRVFYTKRGWWLARATAMVHMLLHTHTTSAHCLLWLVFSLVILVMTGYFTDFLMEMNFLFRLKLLWFRALASLFVLMMWYSNQLVACSHRNSSSCSNIFFFFFSFFFLYICIYFKKLFKTSFFSNFFFKTLSKYLL